MIKKIFVATTFALFCFARPDLSLVGPLLYADGLGRIAMGFMDTLKDKVSINFKSTYGTRQEIPQHVIDIIDRCSSDAGRVAILFDSVWCSSRHPISKMSDKSEIKLAYSMLESTAIPKNWVHLLNNKFDGVIVPDAFHVDVYKNCGVKIPIFILPHGIYLEDFLNQPIKKAKNSPFIFGFSAAFHSDRKNPELLAQAFHDEFGDIAEFKLLIHSRGGDDRLIERLKKKLSDLNNKNIIFVNKKLNKQEYLNFMSSLDCYVSLTKGEGYSITPRESLALGIPTIITNNTAHKTICQTGFVCGVKSEIAEPAYYATLEGYHGYHFNCELKDARAALREVYENYDAYLSKAQQGRHWVRQYLHSSLQKKYLTIVKPKKVVLGKENKIEDNVLITDSKALYNKYRKIVR